MPSRTMVKQLIRGAIEGGEITSEDAVNLVDTQTITGTKTFTAATITTLTAPTIIGNTSQVAKDIDAGASGTAGTVDVFPTTASKGKIQIVATDSTGDTTTTITNAAQTTTATMTIPDTNGSASFVMTAASQTVGGAKAFSSAITPSAGIVTANGISSPRLCHTGGVPAILTTSGTNTANNTAGMMYLAEIFVPCNVSTTGAAVFNGTAVAGNCKYALFSVAANGTSGTRVAVTTSTATAGTTAYQTVAWTGGPIAITGPATYFIGTIYDDTTHDLRGHVLGKFATGTVGSLTYATDSTFATLTVPTTFTADLGPIASLY